MASVKENLIAAKALIDTPEKWAHFDKERRIAGGKCLCAVDAVYAVCHDDQVIDALNRAIPADTPLANPAGMIRAARYNDHPSTTHADIMALFDRAIAAQDRAS